MINNGMFLVKKNGDAYSNCYCTRPELIENYDKAIADKTQVWECHHRMEKYFPQKTLIAIGWYYDCEPEELIFLPVSEHSNNSKLHKAKRGWKCKKGRKAWNKGKKLSEEQKNRMKGRELSEEHKRKISEARKKVNIDKSLYGSKVKGKTWKLIDGKRVWLDR